MKTALTALVCALACPTPADDLQRISADPRIGMGGLSLPAWPEACHVAA